jgi:DUF1680 family protein
MKSFFAFAPDRLTVNWQQLVNVLLIRRAVLVFAVSAVTLVADPPRPVAEPVADAFTAVPNDLQHLGGILASRMLANTAGYLEHIRLNEISQSFAKIADDTKSATKSDLTTGRSAGLLLEASANSYEYSDDGQLKTVMNGLAKLLVSHQEPAGYIGTYPTAQRWSHEDLSAQGAILLGLVAYARVTGNDEALTASRRLANPLVDHLSRGKGAVADARELVRPLLELYRATNDRRYLGFCRRLAGSSLSELRVENDTYSFLSLLSGLADLYQLTADEAYVKAAESGWREIRDQQLTVTGVPATKDDSNIGCLTQAWLRLNLDLLRTRGDPRYADQLERTVYNQLLASQDAETGKIDPCAPESGTKKPSSGIDPCAAAISLAISDIPEMVWGRHGPAVAVLSYQSGHATLRIRRATLQMYAESDYPASGKILLHIEPSHDIRFPLELLVPSWTKSFAAEAGATKLAGKPGQFLTLEREWKKGDTVKISVEMSVSKIEDNHRDGPVAIQRGPQLLVLTRGDGSLADLSAAAVPSGSLSPQPDEDNEGTYFLQGRYQGKAAQLTLLPFADAAAMYRLWLKVAD